MDPIRVATVGVQADTLDSPILDEEISVGPVSPCHGSLVMDGCETAYLTDNSIEEEVVVVADNASDSLSAIESLDSPGSSSHEMAPSYFLASCGDEEKLTFSHQPTLFLAAQGENSILPLEPGVPLINFNETLSQPTTTSSSSDVNQNWFTTKEDKTNLHIKGHSWKQGMFSKEETEILQSNIQKYCEERGISNPATVIFSMTKEERKDFYRTVAKGLNRPLFSVYRRVIRMYDNKNHIGKYSSEELDQLKVLRAAHGNDWRVIGNALGRSAASIKDRCRLMKENCRQGVWVPAEERRLAEAVYDLSGALPGEMVSGGLSWTAVAERVGSRSEKQCRTKWLNYLNWKEAGGTHWTRQDDLTLISTVHALQVSEESMIDWVEFAKDWTSVRSPQWLRGKWWSLKRTVPNAGKLAFRAVAPGLAGGTLQSAAPITLTATADGILEVIPQNFQLPSAPPQAILLTTPGQSSIPISTLPQGQIIIQTLPTEPLQAAESLLVQMHLPPAVSPAELVVNSDTSLPPTEPSSPQPDTGSLDTSDIDSSSSYAMCCIDGEEFQVQEIHGTSLDEVDDPSLVASQMSEHRAESVILSDPMLAGSPGLLGSSSDIDSDKSHVVDGLDGVPEDT
ncbi:cyclin-D-binding Myb-like transcription factor 1 isoform X2 [Dermacentor silvarum]|uniref:cyclin-D-binding Myb-like transcription factor 1 isoform X2 n=1 Tax=Dermacentor silvarum TaxID=543639 RepID=UPI002100ED18|nr:cyclin-D-binding Myb-like transcription factor 1 isoform X2 [Dermacentor silvarum]